MEFGDSDSEINVKCTYKTWYDNFRFKPNFEHTQYTKEINYSV